MRSSHPDELQALVEANRSAILEAVSRHKGRSVSIFGSVARGDDAEIGLPVRTVPDSVDSVQRIVATTTPEHPARPC